MEQELKTPFKISLDFYIRKIITVNAKQLDTNSRIINITCTENGKKVMLDSSTTSAFVRYKKSDGNAVLNEIKILDDSTINLELSQQMLAVEGRHLVDIMLINGTGLTTETVENILNSETMDGISVLSTMSFYVNTEGVAIDSAEIESSYEYNALIDGLGKMVAVDQHMQELDKTLNANEEKRQEDEATRQSNETSRQTAEIEREKRVADVIKNANTAITNTNIATENANNATKYANEAGDNTNAAIERANQASDEVDELIAKYESIEDFTKIDEILNYKVEVTQAEYDALSDEEKNNGKIYFIIDSNMGGTASEVSYDNTTSDLTAPNVQRAIEEVNDKVITVDEDKVDKTSVANNLTTTTTGYVLDARQGKALKDEIGTADISTVGDGTIKGAIADLSPQFAYMHHYGKTTLVNTHIPFTENKIVGDAFSYNNGKVTVEKDDVSYVRISATISGSQSNTNKRCWFKIYRERDGSRGMVAEALQYHDSFCSPSALTICEATKGDIFYVFIPDSESFIVGNGGLHSYFTIEKLC